MNADQAVARLAQVIRRKHLALNTEQSYCGCYLHAEAMSVASPLDA